MQAVYGIISARKNAKIGKKPRTYRKKARKQYLQIARLKKRTAKKVREAIGQTWLRPIVRGKAKAPIEFGAKLDISIVIYNEALKLSDMIERYKERTGSYPERILADKIYRNRENLAYYAE